MSELLIRCGPAGSEGCLISVTPEEAGWRHVGFEVYRLAAGARLRRELADREACVVVLGGTCEVRSEGGEWTLGTRATPFDGPPAAAYVAPRTAFEIAAREAAEIAIGTAPATSGPAPRALPPSGARLEIRGSGAMERRIHHILMEDQPASALLVTEVVTPSGHWSSYPPHKHDTADPPRETQLEEIYYHRVRAAPMTAPTDRSSASAAAGAPDAAFRRSQEGRGFAVQRVYTADRTLDESIAISDGDLVLVPRGYHTVSAAPGYELYYLNVMAGPLRQWRVTFDPDHRWLLG